MLRCFWALAVLCCGFQPGAWAADSPETLEYKVKAGYLYNFCVFVEWPGSALSSGDSPLVVGVMGGNDALPVIQQVLKGKKVNGHPLQVKSINEFSEAADSHILFISRGSGQTAAAARKALKGKAVLLVGETDQFAENGGAIGFVREDERFRLSLNLEAASEAGLKVSSKLASVARLVKGKSSD